ncbi:hypothetical protein V495_00481 [Pseudogymnoascus sp. VKM F-4514 (FW-929)]|nr:hypothetical protein V495_00481 [Pseudogymnoascus sp. VKM F-4514 (FW-929)]KFY66428.1 hypothetical protein V497_00884 [Pseudogymnoascus sp. VKM F-4516 (FW-969)]
MSSSSHFDVLIVGAGISGINAAYRIQSELPHYEYSIIESRGAIGGTWDFFRYPGLRSDSDLHTFGFPWRPWASPESIADGPSIRKYLEDSAQQYGIDRKIKFKHRLVAANWSSDDQEWSLDVDTDDGTNSITARFLILSTGYYDYNEPLNTTIPGLHDFKGQIVHPQSWPEDLDYTGKKVIIIGSGATAITLLPVLAEKATRVTMLQRSPTYLLSLPRVDPIGKLLHMLLPKSLAYKLVRLQFLIIPFLFYQFCRVCPSIARFLLRKIAERQLPKNVPHDPNFNPTYNPWEQRLCVCPNGDFYEALRAGTSDVVTDKIKKVEETGIITESGKTLDADIIVTATGLKLQLAGGAKITVDSKSVIQSEKYIWNGQMIQDVPNAVIVIGYTNASWTLGSDSTAINVCRLLKHMDENSMAYATPRVPEGSNMVSRPMMDLSSTYVKKAKSTLPLAGNKGPWKPRVNYIIDRWTANYGSLTTDMEFTKANKIG